MKITVGHLVIAAGVGTFLVLGPLGGFNRIDKMRGVAVPEKETLAAAPESPAKDLPATPAADNKPALPFEEHLPAGEAEPKDVKASDAGRPLPVPPATVAPKAVEPEAPAPAVKPVRRRRAKAASPAVSASKPSAGASNLLGTYVTLKLANGREVKGALVEQTASLYKIELPGLGAMSYPLRDVISVSPAQ